MSRAAGAPKRAAARRPPPRTIVVRGEGELAEWELTARVDFPFRLMVELQSASGDRAIEILESIIVDHNMPNGDDEVAERLADVEPLYGLMQMSAAIAKAIGQLPPR